ncbi:MarR family winged helix-turn-helix transcriptional regulator [Olsenella sp. DNF00959]|uniref:MarR family winged helix-turn-helix transcriptional regulator n=3 Tax=Atopobiaceae TaxID=1643824 RepID=UPI00078388DC|nr:MarR family transcriptional regulator [Olsenella sp. DNF00959]KXB63445.1 transcriptional regulator, MarR family [Olsenella sp. DNF00959]
MTEENDTQTQADQTEEVAGEKAEATSPKAHEEISLAHKAGRMGNLLYRYTKLQTEAHGGFGDPLRGQGRVLALLKAKPETSQKELSFLLDMRQQSLSELLAKLEEKGFVTRAKSEEDGRVTMVRLTEEGASAAPAEDDMDPDEDVFSCLSAEERAQFEAHVDTVIASLEEKLRALGFDPNARRERHDDRRGGFGRGRDERGGRGGYGRGGFERGGRDERRGGYGHGRDERGGRGGFDRERHDDRCGGFGRGRDERGSRDERPSRGPKGFGPQNTSRGYGYQSSDRKGGYGHGRDERGGRGGFDRGGRDDRRGGYGKGRDRD